MQLVIDNLHKRFARQAVLDGVSLQVETGRLACLLGASGCGKTTLLRCVAGLETPDAGSIRCDGEAISEPGRHIPTEQRAIGLVFQDHALFPHLNVAQNAGFALHQWTRARRQRRVTDVLQLVGLGSFGERFPHQLSGGQQQRAALARALAHQPRILLLDEPFASLDRDLRLRLAREVAEILRISGTTALWVTHDQREAMLVADVIGVMNGGRIEQWDTPSGLFHRPATPFVARFMSDCRFIRGTIDESGAVVTVLGRFAQVKGAHLPAGCSVEVPVRPDQLSAGEGVHATITALHFQGAESECEIKLINGETLLVRIPPRNDLKIGDELQVRTQETTLPAFRISRNGC